MGPFEAFLETIDESWRPFFIDNKNLLVGIQVQLSKEDDTVFPKPENVFRVFRYPLSEVKVIILGQDPYHTPFVANGLAFSVNIPQYIPPSLRNIVNAIEDEYGESMRITEAKSKKDYRKVWGEHQAKQGVMLLNAALTVRRGQAGSHSKLWTAFTSQVVKYLAEYNKDLVWILWGNNAITLVDSNAPGVMSIRSSHPSPLSVSKPCGNNPAFDNAKSFTLANDLLTSLNKTPIEW